MEQSRDRKSDIAAFTSYVYVILGADRQPEWIPDGPQDQEIAAYQKLLRQWIDHILPILRHVLPSLLKEIDPLMTTCIDMLEQPGSLVAESLILEKLEPIKSGVGRMAEKAEQMKSAFQAMHKGILESHVGARRVFASVNRRCMTGMSKSEREREFRTQRSARDLLRRGFVHSNKELSTQTGRQRTQIQSRARLISAANAISSQSGEVLQQLSELAILVETARSRLISVSDGLRHVDTGNDFRTVSAGELRLVWRQLTKNMSRL
ncbi:hypothetical protein [Asticcacaulis sp.]|uniref:hypothetical protein n=1 Tax=Asticcacaulis sp. TaxID=1872648 RepID=UPI00260F8BE4|nr:hypothetical protein [Asticcacaulis sp.]